MIQKLIESNTILKPSLEIPKPVTMLTNSVSKVSTFLAVRIAAKIFATPINFKRPKRESYMWQSAQKRKLYIDALQKEIQLVSYGFSKKKVLLVHGWSGRSTQLFAFADKLLENGYMVIAFDGPAHGLSNGKQTNMIEFLKTVTEIQEKEGPFVAGIGHSFGGMVLYNAVSRFLKLKTFVTIGSGDKVTDILHNFTRNLKMKSSITPNLIYHFERKWKINLADYASCNNAKKIEIPVLVAHDTIDGDVPVSSAVNIRQNLQKGSLLITNGLGHTKILRDKKVINKVVEFIIENT